MKYKILILPIILSFFVLYSCTEGESNNELLKAKTTQNFDWLEGNWIRTNDTEGSQTFETWLKLDEQEYQGFGTTIENGDTVFSESILLHQVNEKWLFEVSGIGEKQPTIFTVTRSTESSFTCENPENEFPTLIKYTKGENSLTAVVSNSEMEILFAFKPKK